MKMLVAVGLPILIYKYIDIDNALALMVDVKVGYLFLCALLLNFDRFFMAFKWSLLLNDSCRFSYGIFSLTKGYYYSLLLSPFVPTTVGTDVVRGISVIKDGGDKKVLVSSIVMERLLGAMAQLLLAVFALFLLSLEYSGIDPFYFYLVFVLILFLAAFTILPLLNAPEKILSKVKVKVPDWKIVVFVKETYLAYKSYRNKKQELLIFFLLSVIESSFSIFAVYWFFRSLGVDVTLYKMMLTVPAAFFFARIPVSIGAIGVQEGFFILFFSMVGISAEEALMVSLVGRVVDITAVLPGCLAFCLYDNFIESS